MLNYSRKVIFSIFALALIVMVPLAYAAVGTFILSFDGTGGNSFDNSVGVAVDSNDRIIVGDTSDGTVQIFESDGTFVIALTPNTSFGLPNRIVVDSNDRIIVGDTTANTAEIYESTGAFVIALSGGDGIANLRGVAVDSNDRIFVADNGDRVVEIYGSNGSYQSEIDGSDAGGEDFIQIRNIVIDSNDRLIVIEGNTSPPFVQIFDSNGSFVSKFFGTGTNGLGTAWDDNFEGIATDASNRILVADGDNTPNKIQIYSSAGTFQSEIDGSDGSTAFAVIANIAVDSNNRILVVESNTVNLVKIYKGFPLPGSAASALQQLYAKPTFGLSHSSYMPLVEDGFTINGKSFDITNNRHTDFEKQTIPVGKTSTFTAKAFAPYGLHSVSFMFGIPQVGQASLAEASIQVKLDGKGDVQNITVFQKNNLINEQSVSAISEMVSCMDNSSRQCNSVSVSASFDEAPIHEVFAIKAVDVTRLSQVTFLNDGFSITGDPLNPPEIDYMANGKEGMVEMMRFDKFESLWVDPNGMTYDEYDNLWVSPDGIVYTKNSYDTWIKLSPYQLLPEDNDLPNSVMTRIHSDFAMLKQEQLDLASEMMAPYYRTSINYEESFSEINDIFTHEYSAWSDGPSDLLMEQEISKANAIMEKLCPECGDLSFDKLTDPIFFESIPVDESIVLATLQQEYLDAIEVFNQRYGHIYNTDTVESIDMIPENTSKIDMKELSQIEISKALEIFEMYGNVYGQD